MTASHSPEWRYGIRSGLKIRHPQGFTSSSLVSGARTQARRYGDRRAVGEGQMACSSGASRAPPSVSCFFLAVAIAPSYELGSVPFQWFTPLWSGELGPKVTPLKDYEAAFTLPVAQVVGHVAILPDVLETVLAQSYQAASSGLPEVISAGTASQVASRFRPSPRWMSFPPFVSVAGANGVAAGFTRLPAVSR